MNMKQVDGLLDSARDTFIIVGDAWIIKSLISYGGDTFKYFFNLTGINCH